MCPPNHWDFVISRRSLSLQEALDSLNRFLSINNESEFMDAVSYDCISSNENKDDSEDRLTIHFCNGKKKKKKNVFNTNFICHVNALTKLNFIDSGSLNVCTAENLVIVPKDNVNPEIAVEMISEQKVDTLSTDDLFVIKDPQ